ncbi:hypothetical protein T459_20982 [Capsicum annuum]|uniref:GPI-anchored protein LLG1-like domain-containing protein n=1 Tax=Capsicum annuum TaxID=4072 RepID=A0A2G2Z626_CAPAN|nr:hypothetical protein T459_20982 [Capsicum annuum]
MAENTKMEHINQFKESANCSIGSERSIHKWDFCSSRFYWEKSTSDQETFRFNMLECLPNNEERKLRQLYFHETLFSLYCARSYVARTLQKCRWLVLLASSLQTTPCSLPNAEDRSTQPNNVVKPFCRLPVPLQSYVNDLTTDCADTMFSYIMLHGPYPPGLFASVCKGDKDGLPCPDVAPPPSDSANVNISPMSCRLSPVLMIATALTVLLLLLL